MSFAIEVALASSGTKIDDLKWPWTAQIAQWPLFCVFYLTEIGIGSRVNYVKVVGVRLMLSAAEMYPKESIFGGMYIRGSWRRTVASLLI